MAKLNGRGGRDALVEALAGQLAVHARAVRIDVAEMIRSAMRAGGYHGDYLDASHIVGVLPPTVGGLPPSGALELVDGTGLGLEDDRGLMLVDDTTFATGGGGGGTPDPHHASHEPGGSDPMAVDAAAATGSLRTLGTGATQAAPGNDVRFGSGGPPTGVASGHLTGTYPGPSIAPLVVTDAMVVAANKDGAAATASMRTLGTGSTQAAAGNDSRFTDSRPPSGTAGGDLSGSYPNPQIASGVITDADVNALNKDGLAAVASLRTLGSGAVQAAAGTHTHGAAAPAAHATTHQPGGSDAMAVDAVAATGSLRTLGAGAQQASAGTHTHGAAAPAAHATTHQPGGADAMAVDAAAATGSLRTLGTSATSAAAGNDARLADSRPPTGAASGDLSGTYPSPQIATGVIVDADVNAANKDGAAATPSLRTLGTGAAQAAAGNHAHATYVTNPMTTSQDIIVGGVAGAPGRLGIGGSTQVLTVVGGVLTWATPASGFANPMTSVGDLITGGASGAAQRLGVGTTDQVLAVVAGAPAWANPAATASLLVNGGMEVWQRGAGTFTSGYTADRWQILPGGSTLVQVTRATSGVDVGSLFCAQLSINSFNLASSLYQKVEDYTGLRGRTITFAVRVLGFVASAARPWISNDGGATFTYGAYHSGGGAYETLTLTYAVPAGSAQLSMGVQFGANGTYYIDNATLCIGSAALAYVPLHPTDDLNRCLRYFEILGGGDPFESLFIGQATAATNAKCRWPFAVQKAVAPTLSFSAAGDFFVQSAAANITPTGLTFSQQTVRSVLISFAVAAGLVANDALAVCAANTNCRLAAEANP